LRQGWLFHLNKLTLVNVLSLAPKYNSDIEKAILGVFIRDNVLFIARKGLILKDDFYLLANQAIFSACVKLVSDGYKCDILSLARY
jgi:replicative DNA helicase